jgi:hypothetical protein
VLGLATAETSTTVRLEQPVSLWNFGFAVSALQPLPPPLHAASIQPRGLEEVVRVVPPTATT